ncbi:hypothetical protein L4D76_28080 [Photobacterium sagamiensis]
MHAVRSVTADERGRQVIPGDVILGVFGAVQHKNHFGMDLLMSRYVDDENAKQRVLKRIDSWVSEPPNIKRRDIALTLCYLAFDTYCEKPVSSQYRLLSALWRNHSDKGRRAKRLIKQWQCSIKTLQRKSDSAASKSAKARIDREVADLESNIASHRRYIESYADTQATNSCRCPRCQGAGQVMKPAIMECPACTGKGYLMPTPDNIRTHLRRVGVARISANLFDNELRPLFERCLQWLYQEQGETVKALTVALEKERVA